MASPTPTPDVLFARHLAGDAVAFEQLVAHLSPELREFARQIGADAQQSEDAVQDLWLAVLTSGRSFDLRRPLMPWLRAVLRFRWRTAYRRESRWRALVADAWRPNSAKTANGHAQGESEAEALVRAALQNLPARYGEPLELSLIDGLSPLEIAERLALPRSTVRVLLYRGRALLRESLPRGVWALLGLLLLHRRARATPAWPLAASIAVTLLLCVAATSRVVVGVDADHVSGVASRAKVDTLASESMEVASSVGEREPAATSDELTVVTVHGDGHALAGVGITVEPRDGSDPRLHRQQAATNADGRALFARPPGVALQISSDRRATAELGVDERTCKLTIFAGRSVRGRAADESGVALAGAEVWLGNVGGSRRGQVVALTAADGSFALDAVPADASLALFAAGHRRTAMLALPPVAADGFTHVQLTAVRGGARLRVLVRDEGGTPLPGARVSIGRSMDGAPQRLADGMLPAFPPPLERIADAAGAVEVEGLEPGAQPIVARATGHAPASCFVYADDGEQRNVELTLARGSTVHGRVVDLEGEPLAGAQVAWINGDPLADLALIAAPDGSFVADGVASGPASIAARCFDHGVAERHFDAPAGVTLGIELALSSLPICEGELHDDAGTPLAGFEIRLLGAPESSFAPDADDGRTDEQGHFTLAVPGGQIRRLEVRGLGWPQWMNMRRSWLREDGSTLRVSLPRAAMPSSALVGRLRYADGSAVHARKLDLLRRFDDSTNEVVHAVARTSADGELRIGPLHAGRYALLLTRAGDDEPIGVVGEYELGEGAELDVSSTLPPAREWECELHFADGNAPSALVASLTTGQAEAGLALWLTAEQRLQLLPGSYALHAMGDEFAWVDGSAIEIAADSDARWATALERALSVRLWLAALPATLDVGAGLTIEHVADGRAVEHFELLLDSQRPQVLQSFLSAGEYRASVQRRDGSAAEALFEVDALGPRQLELRFDR